MERDTVYWDRTLPGFGVRVYATGSKVYVVQTRSGGRSKRVTIGRHGVVTAEQARRRAALIIARIKSGEPAVTAGERKGNGPTVSELAERYLREHVDVRCKPSTASRVRTTLRAHLPSRVRRLSNRYPRG